MAVYQRQQGQQRHSAVTAHDLDVLRRHHQFLRDDDADLERGARDWEVRMSVRYYRRLFREYALADLSRYRDGQIGLRWRTETEVVAGKGQFSCGNKRCDETRGLHSYELLFAYIEQSQKKRCLVKVRVCEDCARKLFYRKLKQAKERREKRKRRRRENEDEDDDAEQDEREEESTSRRRQRRQTEDDKGDSQRTQPPPPQSIHDVCARLNADETAQHRREHVDTREHTENEDDDDDAAITQLLL
ncbi:hypothetical protein PINS_up005309 [Pythium insidiosum]|nr:hypothetical protein PINS_up005309 [Pythium insidiosum]